MNFVYFVKLATTNIYLNNIIVDNNNNNNYNNNNDIVMQNMLAYPFSQLLG